MLNHIFYIMRDIKNEYETKGVTENVTSEAIKINGDIANVRVDVEGLKEDNLLSIKFEQSNDGVSFSEIGTFPIPDAHHGIVFARFQEYVRYELIVAGTSPNLNVKLSF